MPEMRLEPPQRPPMKLVDNVNKKQKSHKGKLFPLYVNSSFLEDTRLLRYYVQGLSSGRIRHNSHQQRLLMAAAIKFGERKP